jgi:hypothetical protein
MNDITLFVQRLPYIYLSRLIAIYYLLFTVVPLILNFGMLVFVSTGPMLDSQDDVYHSEQLINTLSQHADPVSAFLWQKMPKGDQAALWRFSTHHGYSFDEVSDAIDRIIEGQCIYESNRFKGIQLRNATRNLLQQPQTGANLDKLNRMLLEDAYPGQLPHMRETRWNLTPHIDLQLLATHWCLSLVIGLPLLLQIIAALITIVRREVVRTKVLSAVSHGTYSSVSFGTVEETGRSAIVTGFRDLILSSFAIYWTIVLTCGLKGS